MRGQEVGLQARLSWSARLEDPCRDNGKTSLKYMEKTYIFSLSFTVIGTILLLGLLSILVLF